MVRQHASHPGVINERVEFFEPPVLVLLTRKGPTSLSSWHNAAKGILTVTGC